MTPQEKKAIAGYLVHKNKVHFTSTLGEENRSTAMNRLATLLVDYPEDFVEIINNKKIV